MEFNKEEISLCKQVAEKYRKNIEYGDWYWSNSHNKPLIAIAGGFKADEQKHFGVFKIWTISDCLKFLEEKGYWMRIDPNLKEARSRARIWVFSESETKKQWTDYPNYRGKTTLEACLKAVLAVLEEEK